MRTLASILLVLLLSGCVNPVSFLTGGGPNVAANVQAGQENNQSVVDTSSDVSGETVTIDNSQVKPSGYTESISVMNQDIPFWVILLLILGWVLPSPREIWRGFLKTITLGKYNG